jgi:outer membrane protein assembly factor BamC
LTRKFAARAAVLLAAAAAGLLAGCGGLDKGVEYKSAGSLPPLDVPPDLTVPARDNRFVLPDGATKGTATLSGYQAERQEARTNTTLLPLAERMRVERDGSERWLVVQEPADKVWPLVKEFWQENGFLIKLEIPEAGVLETDWAENRSKIPQGTIRNFLGSIMDSAYSTGERDKFRTRMERSDDNKATEIFISHRGLQEVYGDAKDVAVGNVRTVWQPRPPDPGLEAEMLRRLMVRLGAADEKARQLIAAAPTTDRARISKGADGAELLQVSEPFDRTWRRVGLALDRGGFTVEDRDRQKGLYFVRYADPEQDLQKPSLFDRITDLGKDSKIKPEQYRVQVKGEQETSQVLVLGKDGAPESSKTAQRILALLHEQLK